MYNLDNKLTSPEDTVEDDVPIIEVGSDWDSTLRMWSQDQTSRTLNVAAPSLTLSDFTEMPKQKDFPSKALTCSGRSSGSSICVIHKIGFAHIKSNS